MRYLVPRGDVLLCADQTMTQWWCRSTEVQKLVWSTPTTGPMIVPGENVAIEHLCSKSTPGRRWADGG